MFPSTSKLITQMEELNKLADALLAASKATSRSTAYTPSSPPTLNRPELLKLVEEITKAV
jgi:hypothetical protein